MNDILKINTPFIEKTEYGTVKLNVDMEECGSVDRVFYEVEEEYGRYLSDNRADFALYLAVPVAIREGYDIVCNTPVTEILLHNIVEVLIPTLQLGDSGVKDIKIYAPTSTEPIGGNAVGTGISCGVDSMYTVQKYENPDCESMKLTHLFLGSLNSELWGMVDDDNVVTWGMKFDDSIKRCQSVADDLGVPLIKMFTNAVKWACKERTVWSKHLFMHHYITMSAVLALRKLWSVYYFSSAYEYSHFNLKNNLTLDTADHELLSMHVLGLRDFTCYSAGQEKNRIEKTLALSEYDLARKYLHPCNCKGPVNCSRPNCSSYKCLRALMTYDYYDKLDAMSIVFDVERYRKNRREYIWWLQRNRNDSFLKDLYKLISSKYPDEVNSIDDESARIDLQIIGDEADFEFNASKLENYVISPDWINRGGRGYCIVSKQKAFDTDIKVVKTGKFVLVLRGVRFVRDGKSVPKYIRYTKLCINNDIIFEQDKVIWHDKPYIYKKDVESGEILHLHIEWDKI